VQLSRLLLLLTVVICASVLTIWVGSLVIASPVTVGGGIAVVMALVARFILSRVG
jgi:hypothetical protein